MKYLITNPDSFGDIVLRQPLFKGLLDAGHEVAVLVKKSYSTIVHFLDPRLKMFMIDDLNPYVVTVLEGKDNVNAVLDEAAAFNPDVVVAAPYQRTLIDNWTLDRFSDRRTVGMKGIEVDYEGGVRIFRPVTRRVKKLLHVPENLSEVEKNRRLLSLCLGQEVKEYQPRLTLPAASRSLAESTLKQLQLKKNDFVICALGSASVPIKQYPTARFTHILEHWAKTHKRNILLVGNKPEQATIDEISASLRKSRISTSTWIGNEAELEILLGLISLSKVYFGNDTGPMHFAAAFGKPVIAIFGGGHWPRFVPAAKEGVAILQELPCFGCGWQCIFEKAICIQSIDEKRIIEAVDSFEGGTMKQLKILSKPFEGEISSTWIQEAKEKMKSYKGQIESTRVEREKESKGFEEKVKSLTDEIHASVGNASKVQDRVQFLEAQNKEYQTELSQTKQWLQLTEEKCQLIADQIESEKHFNATVLKEFEEQKQLNIALTKQVEEEKRLNLKLSKQLEEEKRLNSALANEMDDGKRANASLRKGFDEEKQLNIALTNEIDDEKRASASLRKQLEEKESLSLRLSNQAKSNEEKMRLLQMQLSEQANQLKKEREAQAQTQSLLKVGEDNSRTLQTQINRQNEQLRNLTGQLDTERKTTLNLKSEIAEAAQQLKQKKQILKDTTGYLRDLKPKLEELHLTVRLQEENMQQLGESLDALMKSGWIRLGIRVGIPWLSRWHHQMFGARSLDAVFPFSRDKFQAIVSYKESLRTRIDEIVSTLSQ